MIHRKIYNRIQRLKREIRSFNRAQFYSRDENKKYFYLSFHKCGTQYTMKVLREICRTCQLDWYKTDWRYHLKNYHVRGNDFIFISDYSSRTNGFLGKFNNYKAFLVHRDPRDVLISLYYSHRDSHGLNSAEIKRDRNKLNQLNVNEGIEYLLEQSSYFKRMMNELKNLYPFRNQILFVRFEDLISNPLEIFEKIFNELEINVPSLELAEINRKINFETLKKRHPSHQKNLQTGHYRSGKIGEWQDYFSPELATKFRSLYGNLLGKLGYSEDV